MFFQEFNHHPWRQISRLQAEANRLLEAVSGTQTVALQPDGPPLNVAVGTEGAYVTALLPGIDAASLDVAILSETLTLKGQYSQAAGEAKAPADKATQADKHNLVYHRRERPSGSFARTIQLPFRVAVEQVVAHYRQGILQLTLPRAAEDRPRRIAIHANQAA